MTHKHQAFEDLANTLIEASGTVAQIVGPPTQTGPDWEPVLTDPTPIDCNVFVTSWSIGEIDGTVIRTGDRKLLVALEGLTFDIEAGHKITIAGEQLQIIDPVERIAPAGDNIVYKLNARS